MHFSLKRMDFTCFSMRVCLCAMVFLLGFALLAFGLALETIAFVAEYCIYVYARCNWGWKILKENILFITTTARRNLRKLDKKFLKELLFFLSL